MLSLTRSADGRHIKKDFLYFLNYLGKCSVNAKCRIDVVFYLLDAMRLFREKSMEWYSRSPSRSGCWDSTGWTSSSLNRRTSCGVVAGEDVLGATTRLHHICRLQEKRIELRIGVDLGEEREMAEEIGEEKKRIE
ncbi:MAG: hypothetical protein PHQ39_02275 [Methanothrix soehngenii]|nr:hypothetical protein [Methanothrix soehngenii]